MSIKHGKMNPLVGGYSFAWINDDEVKIVKDYGNLAHEATMAGGDFETLLSCAFVNAKLTINDNPNRVIDGINPCN